MSTPDLIFLYGAFVPACTHYIDKEYVRYQTLQYMTGGGVELSIDSRRHVLEGHWFWSAYPGPRFRFYAAAGHATWEHRYLAFQGPLVTRWQQEGLFPVPPRRPPEGVDYAARFDRLLHHARQADRRDVRRGVHLLEGILLELADAREPAEEPAPWLGRATAMLSRWIDRGTPDYAALTDKLGISESTLRRQFRQATGTTPHAYLLQCRATEARRLLGETDLPIKAIADRLGYKDVYFFSRQFRQLTGVPPAAYRKSRQ